MKKNIFYTIIANMISLCITLVVLVPIVVVILNSFKSRVESSTMSLKLPEKWLFSNYLTVIEQGKLINSFTNSLIYSIFSVLIIVVVVTSAAFVLSRNRSRLNRFIYYYMVLGIAMPINNVALMKVMKMTGLINTRPGIILIYAAINIPLSLFLVYGFIGGIPKEIDEAAIIDGAGPLGMFIKVIMPLMTPIMATIFVLNVMAIWNDFTMPLYYLNNSAKWPMTLAVYNFFGTFQRQWNFVSADIVLTVFPVTIIFILGQRYIVDGISAGSVKG